MDVLIDVTPIIRSSSTSEPTGVGRWVSGAIMALSEQAPSWRLHLLDWTSSLDPTFLSNANVVIHQAPISRVARRLRGFRTPRELVEQTGSIDVVLGTTFVPWKFPGAVNVPVVYDLAYIHAASTVRTGQMLFLRTVMGGELDRAAAVVTISESVKREIVERYGKRPEDIFVAHPGISGDGRTPEASNIPIPALPSRFLLFVGTLEPRKNIVALLGAISALDAAGKDIPTLVIVGGEGWKSNRSKALLQSFRQQHPTEVLGYVPAGLLPLLYSRATMLVFPSIYEGFGMPPLEAMSYGCPVVASDIPTSREVLGEAGFLVALHDEAALGAAILEVLNNQTVRDRMVSMGRRRATTFTWSRCADAVIAAVEYATGNATRHRR